MEPCHDEGNQMTDLLKVKGWDGRLCHAEMVKIADLVGVKATR